MGLVIGILFGYCQRAGYAHKMKYVWAGTGAAVLISVRGSWMEPASVCCARATPVVSACGSPQPPMGTRAVHTSGAETFEPGSPPKQTGIGAAFGGIYHNEKRSVLEGEAEGIFEGTIILAAAILLTTMILWTASVGSDLKSEVEGKLKAALESESDWKLFAIPFFQVLREGIEVRWGRRAGSRMDPIGSGTRLPHFTSTMPLLPTVRPIAMPARWLSPGVVSTCSHDRRSSSSSPAPTRAAAATGGISPWPPPWA